jgi:hypothetical protein
MLSTQEADWFKQYIKEKNPSQLWLVRPNGRALIGPRPKDHPEISDLLWQVNCYNGNIQELLKTPALTLKKLKELEKIQENLLYDYLIFKAPNNPEIRKTIRNYFSTGQRPSHLLEDLI